MLHQNQGRPSRLFSHLISNCIGKVTCNNQASKEHEESHSQCVANGCTTKSKIIVMPFLSHGVKYPPDASL